jgi:hypothetical protein
MELFVNIAMAFHHEVFLQGFLRVHDLSGRVEEDYLLGY